MQLSQQRRAATKKQAQQHDHQPSSQKNLLASFRNLNQHAAWQWVPVRFK
jgi:hypothetical protein